MRYSEYVPTSNKGISLVNAKYENFAFKKHFHLEYHFGLISVGNQIFNYKGTKHNIGPNIVQIMPPGEVHDGHTLKKQGFSTRIFSIAPNWLTSLFDDSKAKNEVPIFQYCIENRVLFNELIYLHKLLQTNQVCQLALDSIPVEYFSKLLELHGNLITPSVHKIGHLQLKEINDYLMSNLGEKIQLVHLAELCQISESKLLRSFKASVGMTPYAWLRRLRLEYALSLLRSGWRSTDVCFKVGFYDQPHFIGAFKSAYGVTPVEISSRSKMSFC